MIFKRDAFFTLLSVGFFAPVLVLFSKMENLIVLCENMTIAFHMFRLTHGKNRDVEKKTNNGCRGNRHE